MSHRGSRCRRVAGSALALVAVASLLPFGSPSASAIVDGEPVSVADTPWVVSVNFVDDADLGTFDDGSFSGNDVAQHRCNGVLLDAGLVLTAARCVDRALIDDPFEVDAEDLEVIIGASDLGEVEFTPGVERIPVSSVLIHHGWRDSFECTFFFCAWDPGDDLALLFLKQKSSAPNAVLWAPGQVPGEIGDTSPVANPVELFGWGDDGLEPSDGVFRHTTAAVVTSWDVCAAELAETYAFDDYALSQLAPPPATLADQTWDEVGHMCLGWGYTQTPLTTFDWDVDPGAVDMFPGGLDFTQVTSYDLEKAGAFVHCDRGEGGPAARRTDKSHPMPGVLAVQAIYSITTSGTATPHPCPGRAVYTNLSAYHDWLHKALICRPAHEVQLSNGQLLGSSNIAC